MICPKLVCVTIHCSDTAICWTYSHLASRIASILWKKYHLPQPFSVGNFEYFWGRATRIVVRPRGYRPQILILFSFSFQSLLSSSYADNSIRLSFSFVIWKILYPMWRICVPIWWPMWNCFLIWSKTKAETSTLILNKFIMDSLHKVQDKRKCPWS